MNRDILFVDTALLRRHQKEGIVFFFFFLKKKKSLLHDNAPSLPALFEITHIVVRDARLPRLTPDSFDLDVLFSSIMPPPEYLDFHSPRLYKVNVPLAVTDRDYRLAFWEIEIRQVDLGWRVLFDW